LDDRDNPWLDEAIIEVETTGNIPRPSQSKVKKKIKQKEKVKTKSRQ